MKNLIIGLVIGLIAGVSISLSTTSFAAVGDTVSAVFAEFKYVVNGEEKTLDAPVLVYEGGSYLRTTQIANMLGYDVTYKSDSRTIEFNNDSAKEPPSKPIPNETNNPEPTPTGTQGSTESPSPSPSSTPNGAEPTPTPTASPTPSPAPDNTAACQAIKNDYAYQIAALAYGPKNDLGHIRLYTLQLEYQRDQELAAAGCK